MASFKIYYKQPPGSITSSCCLDEQDPKIAVKKWHENPKNKARKFVSIHIWDEEKQDFIPTHYYPEERKQKG